MKTKNKRKKVRNWYALDAILGRKTSPHPDKKALASKQACRGRYIDLD